MSANAEPDLPHRARLAHMHHELRTPLNAIIGYSEILIQDAAARQREAALPDLNRIRGAGTRLHALVNELLDPSRILASLASQELESFRSTVRHELRTPLNHILGYCEILQEDADAFGWSEMAAELERIHIAAREFLGQLDELLAFVEHPDADSNEARSDPSYAASTIAALRAPEPPLLGGACGNVLVVDDNEGNRDLLARWLARDGFTVTAAEDGRRALTLLRDEAFDLVLLDVMMPGLNGFEVLQCIKADEELRHLPVVMVSALTEIDSVVRCIALGAEDYLTKPFNPILLRARVGACMEKKRLRDREVLHLHEIELERQRADDLLHVIFPAQIVQELKATATVKPQYYENVAVLFTDVVEFTPYCERSDPEEVIASLQELIGAYEEVVLEYGMEKIKTFGDSFMATAGLLKHVDNPALNGVECGLRMVEIARSLPTQWKVRVGVHMGSVVAGVVGKRQYLFDLWGDTVNTASRIESHGAEGHVNVSTAVWEALEGRFHGTARGQVLVKGKGAMDLYQVTGRKG